MNTLETVAYHEAGHAVIYLLEESLLGPIGVISILPDGESVGRVTSAKHATRDARNPRVLRALGRLDAAGAISERLAGSDKCCDFGSDAADLAKMASLRGRGYRFVQQSIVGAEFQLRMNWAGVEALAASLLEFGELKAPSGIELARMTLDAPPCPLGLDGKTLGRLLEGIESIPELADPTRAVLGEILLPVPAKAPRAGRRRIK